MRDLSYQLKQLCHRNRDGSYATQAKRMHLMLIADQLYDLGFRGMKLRSVKQKQVDALVKDWLRQGLAVGIEEMNWLNVRIGKKRSFSYG